MTGLRTRFEPALRRAFHLYWRFARGMTLGVRAVVLDADGRVFLVKHSYVSGWHLPGGGVEVGESVIEALKRELVEEGRIELVGEPALHGMYFNSHVSRRDHVAVFVVRDFRQDRLPEPNREIVATGFFEVGPCTQIGYAVSCTDDAGRAGSQVCLSELVWSRCGSPTPQAPPLCTPGDNRPCDSGCSCSQGTQSCNWSVSEGVTWGPCGADCSCEPPTPTGSSSGTPLVLSFSNAAVAFTVDRVHGFALDPSASMVTDWPTAATPWIALDRDGNGSIDDGAELFGSVTPLATGGTAANGFQALRELDSDRDGLITTADARWSRLMVWADRDGDRRSAPEELAPLSAFGIVSIDVDYRVETACDARGNCEVERGGFRYVDAAGVASEGRVVDVHLRTQH